ncbi:unnamed protein product [Closterium sp. Naga37s-1]|nr:unnamed protein product [Closterium sp. Naga37s-1]
MVGWRPWWPKPRPKPHDTAGDLNPVLLIPGIGGSILNAVSEDGKKKERIWVRLYNADQEFRTKLWSKYNPNTGKSESLDDKSHIEVPDDNHGLYSCDILDPDVSACYLSHPRCFTSVTSLHLHPISPPFASVSSALRLRSPWSTWQSVPLDVVCYYHHTIVEMRKWGFKDGETLFATYFLILTVYRSLGCHLARPRGRLPETLDRLRARLEAIVAASGRRVDVVTHSMGGLLFKSFVALHPADAKRLVRKWVSIAAPFRGAPGFIMDTLLTGVEFLKGWQKSLFISKWTMHQLIEVNGRTVPLPFNRDIVRWADETRRIWAGARLPPSIDFYTVYGTGLDTPFHSQYAPRSPSPSFSPSCPSLYGSPKDPLNDLPDILHSDATFDCVHGDGTVPIESALVSHTALCSHSLPPCLASSCVCRTLSPPSLPRLLSCVCRTLSHSPSPSFPAFADGFPARFRVGVPGAEHRELLRLPRVFSLLHFFLEVKGKDPLYDPLSDFVIVPRPLGAAEEEQGEGEGKGRKRRKMVWGGIDVWGEGGGFGWEGSGGSLRSPPPASLPRRALSRRPGMEVKRSQQWKYVLLAAMGGVLALLRLISPVQASCLVMLAYILSRRHSNEIQRQWERAQAAKEAQRRAEEEALAALPARKRKAIQRARAKEAASAEQAGQDATEDSDEGSDQ